MGEDVDDDDKMVVVDIMVDTMQKGMKIDNMDYKDLDMQDNVAGVALHIDVAYVHTHQLVEDEHKDDDDNNQHPYKD